MPDRRSLLAALAFVLASVASVAVAAEDSPRFEDPHSALLVRILDLSTDLRTEPATHYDRRVLLLRSGEVWVDQEADQSLPFTTAWAPRDPLTFEALQRRLRELRVGTVSGYCAPGFDPAGLPELRFAWFGRPEGQSHFDVVSSLPPGVPPCTDGRIPELAQAIQDYVAARLAAPEAWRWKDLPDQARLTSEAAAGPPSPLLIRVRDVSVDYTSDPPIKSDNRQLLLASGEIWVDQRAPREWPFGGPFTVGWAAADRDEFAELARRIRELRIGTADGICDLGGPQGDWEFILEYSWYGRGGRQSFFEHRRSQTEAPDPRVCDLAATINGYVQESFLSPDARAWNTP